MQKKAILALLLAAMLVLSSCSLIKKDMDVDAATEIVRVGDTVYTKAEVQTAVSNYLSNLQQSYYQQYGFSFDTTDAATVSAAQDTVIETLIRGAVIDQKAAELGASPLTEEEQAEVDSTWQESYDLIKDVFFADTELEGEELDEQVEAAVYYYFGQTKSSLEAAEIQSKLKNIVVADVTVSEEEVQADFDAKVEEAKTTYETNLSAYGSAVNNGTTVYYAPSGYRMVKQILIQFTAEDQDILDKLEEKISAQDTQITSLTSALTAAAVEDVDAQLEKVTATVDASGLYEVGELGTTVTDLVAETTDTLEADLDETVAENLRALKQAQELKATYEAALAEATEQAYANIDPQADDVLAQLADGADWDTLMAERTEDPGMQAGRTTAETGYAVCENFADFDPSFTAAAMAIPAVGEWSDKTRGSYGYYIIQYTSEVEEGPIDTEEVRTAIHDELLSTKQDEVYNAQIDLWVSQANAKVDKNSLNN